MVTREQAIKAGESWGRVEFHYGTCKKLVGPRGGITYKIETWRSNGKCKTWKTRPDEFQLPIKYGLRDCAYLDHRNCNEFHLESECPLNAIEDQQELKFAHEQTGNGGMRQCTKP